MRRDFPPASRHAGLFALFLVACSGGKDGTGTNPSTVDPFGQFINTKAATAGDFACFTPAADPATVVFAESSVDPAKQSPYPLNGIVEDFEEETPVSSATLALFLDNTVAGGPDATTQSDVNGNVSFPAVNACEPITYRTTTEGGPVATKRTYETNQIYSSPTGPSIAAGSFNSVSEVTYQLIPGILGIDVKPELAIVAGTAFDCGRDPADDGDVGKIEGAQVVVYDADGNIPDTLQVNYFVQNFPARDQKSTSADGLWVAANVPPGQLTVEMWGNVGGELVLLGATNLTSEADSINIANIYAGYGDGVKFPASCAP